MAVLFEGINVIVKKDSIKIKYPGGLKQFKNDIPNLTETEDSKLIRVGFMEAIDAETYTSFLESNGLTYKDSDGNSVDIIIGDQLLGLCAPCNWVEIRKFHIMDKGVDGTVLSANLKAHLYTKNDPFIKFDQDYLSTYKGWRYDICLSKDHIVQMPGDNRLKYLGKRNDGVYVWWDQITEQPFYSAISGLAKALLGRE